MEIIFMLAVVGGIYYGIKRGSEFAKAAVSKAYQSRRAAWAATPGNSRTAGWGSKAAAGIATGLTGAGLATRGFLKGWRQGWPEGQRRARERWGHLQDQQPRPEPQQAHEPLRLVKDPPAYRETETPTRKGPDMAIATVTGGEIMTMDQLIAELDKIAEEATADMEDASADAQRAKEDAGRVELMVASLQALDLDQQTLAEVGALGDSSSARQAASDQRLAAAEARHAQALTAVQGVRSRHQLMAEAHASTPHAAVKQFYAG